MLGKVHHIMVGDRALCDWLGCKAGRDIAHAAGVHSCDHKSGAAAKRAAQALRPHFKVRVRAVAGPCPDGPRAEA